MNLVNDIVKSKIKCSCVQCTRCGTCLNTNEGLCYKADIINKQNLLQEALCSIRDDIPMPHDTRMKVLSDNTPYTYNDKIPTLYRYYIGFINDVLYNIRHGETDYVFNLEQVKDILRYEPDIELTYQDDFCYEIKKY